MKPLNRIVQILAIASALTALAHAAPQDSLWVGPPTPLAGDAAIGPAGGVQQFPAIAAGDDGYLVVWEDHRSGFAAPLTKEGSFDIFARRLAADGTPLDTLPLRLTDVPGRKQEAEVAFHDGVWLVAWEQEVPTTFSKSVQLTAVRVATDGTVLDPAPIAVRTYGSSSALGFALTSDASGWAFVVQGSSAGESLLEGYRVAPNGTVSPAGSAPLLPGAGLWTWLDLASDGTNLLLAGSSGGVLRSQRLDATYGFQGASVVLAGGGAERPRIASDGNGFLVAWENQSNWSIQARTVSSAGVVGSTVGISTINEQCYHANVTWDGSEYLVAYAATTFVWPQGLTEDVRVARVAANGAVLDVPGAALGQGVGARDPDVAALGSGDAQLVWRDRTTPPQLGDVSTAAIEPGAFGPAAIVATSASRQSYPDLAAGGTGFLAVFTSERNGAVDVLAQRLDPAGAAIDAEPIVVADGPDFAFARVAWNGDAFLVVWQDQGESPGGDRVFARRLGADGVAIDAAPFEVLDGGTPDVAAVGDTFLVVARRAVTTQIYHIYGVRVDGSGQVVAPELQVGGNFARYPEVDAMSDRWVVTWQRNPSHDNPSALAFARVVLADATMGPVAFLDGGSRPAVAAADDEALVVWSGDPVRGVLLDAGGIPRSAVFAIGDGPGAEYEATAAWDGSVFIVGWQDTRNALSFVDERRDVFAGRVTPAGVLLDGPGGVPVFADPDDDAQPTVASSAGGQALFAATRFFPGEPFATARVVVASASSWSFAGGGSGASTLAGGGTLLAGGQVGFELIDAPAGSAGLHMLGVTAWNIPLWGAVLVPAPDVLLPFAVDAGGRASLVLPIGTLPAGLTVWAQSWFLDPAAPAGLAASNALVQSAP